MGYSIIRLTSISLENFKNVLYGKVDFPIRENTGSVLGIYGQNGSGKTALIRAIGVLKCLLSELPFDKRLNESIHVDAQSARLVFEFQWIKRNDQGEQSERFSYEVSFVRKKKKVLSEEDSVLLEREIAEIQGEKLNVWMEDSSAKVRKTCLIDTNSTDLPFGSRAKFQKLIGSDKTIGIDLRVNRELTRERSLSFIFSSALSQALNTRLGKGKGVSDRLVKKATEVINRLRWYGSFELFVLGAEQFGRVNLGAMMLQIKTDPAAENPGACGSIPLSLNAPCKIPTELLGVVQSTVKKINLVLTELVPGLTIACTEVSEEIGEQGRHFSNVELTSLKNGRPIPLRYESDGIKKIISVLNLLICVYTQRSITVAIDELDAGVFEYLLGELMRILSEKGFGQLIFTSHNLRALETMRKTCIVFTTVNPKDRYFQMKNVKETNNLRDMYYRKIVLDPDEAQRLYSPTNNERIALAMREAGLLHE